MGLTNAKESDCKVGMSVSHFDAVNYCGSSDDEVATYYGRWNGIKVSVPRGFKDSQQFEKECKMAEALVDQPPVANQEVKAERDKIYKAMLGGGFFV